MATIFLHGIQAQAIVGVYEHERHQPRPIFLDLELETDIDQAAAQDDINAAVDYAKVTQRLTAFVAETQFELIETLADRCVSMLLREFSVTKVTLTLHKPGALGNEIDVGIRLVREKASLN